MYVCMCPALVPHLLAITPFHCTSDIHGCPLVVWLRTPAWMLWAGRWVSRLPMCGGAAALALARWVSAASMAGFRVLGRAPRKQALLGSARWPPRPSSACAVCSGRGGRVSQRQSGVCRHALPSMARRASATCAPHASRRHFVGFRMGLGRWCRVKDRLLARVTRLPSWRRG